MTLTRTYRQLVATECSQDKKKTQNIFINRLYKAGII